MTDLAHVSTLSSATIGRLIAAGDVDPVALTEYLYGQIDAHTDKSVFISLTRERAMREAGESASRHRAGKALSPLDGVPIVYKDLVDLEGEITTAGSEIYRNAKPALQDASIAANLRLAGMICLGKVNLTEFAYSGLGLNPHFGTPRNPHSQDVARAPGGSSSGTGVAIAAGFAPCGIGTDTGGSIRIPASFNGVVGYKPSRNRIDDEGVFALSKMLDSVGPLARSVEDCILLEMAMRGMSTSDVVRKNLKDVRIIVPETIVLDDLDPAVSDNFEISLGLLSAAGADIARMPVSVFQDVMDLTPKYGNLTAADAYAEHYDLVESSDIERIDRRVVKRIMAGKKMSAVDVVTLQRAQKRLISEINAFVGDALVAMPTTAITAPKTEPLDADDEHFNATNLKVLRNTSIGNMLDFAGVALPNGFDGDGMPTSFLISSIQGRDSELLGYSLAIEKALTR